MGRDVPKQFLPLGGLPVLMHTINSFLSFEASMKVILVLPSDQVDYWRALCQQYNFPAQHQVTTGGDTRYQSVKNGLALVKEDGLVAVHDGVRPFAGMDTIQRSFEAARQYGAAIPVIEMIESIRKVEGEGSRVCSRNDYKLVQTPQVFRISVLKRAYELPYHSGFTDDASVVEASGFKVSLVAGNRENIKITSPFDLLVAEALLNK